MIISSNSHVKSSYIGCEILWRKYFGLEWQTPCLVKLMFIVHVSEEKGFRNLRETSYFCYSPWHGVACCNKFTNHFFQEFQKHFWTLHWISLFYLVFLFGFYWRNRDDHPTKMFELNHLLDHELLQWSLLSIKSAHKYNFHHPLSKLITVFHKFSFIIPSTNNALYRWSIKCIVDWNSNINKSFRTWKWIFWREFWETNCW